MQSLNSKQTSFLRGLGHKLHPVVMIGQHGLTEAVIKEIDHSLKAHELIKVQVAGDDREARIAILTHICSETGATAIHHIGKQLVIYRRGETPKIVLP